MKIFIAGGAGFIGSSVSDKLLQLGHEVMVYDNYSSGSERNNVPHNNLTVLEGDIKNRHLTVMAIRKFHPDIVIHAAVEPVRQPISEWNDIQTNIAGTQALIEGSKLVNVKRFIYFQTVLIYGAVDGVQPLKTDAKLDPKNSYAISKLAAEQYIVNSGLDYISFRLANHYGPRNLTGAFPVFYKKLKENKQCQISDERRTFVFISDLVELVIKACNYKWHPSGIYHVSSWEDYSIKEIFLHMYKIINETDYDEASDEHQFVPASEKAMKTMNLDWSKTMEVFDWVPNVSLSKGIRKTIEWYERNGVEKTFTHFQR